MVSSFWLADNDKLCIAMSAEWNCPLIFNSSKETADKDIKTIKEEVTHQSISQGKYVFPSTMMAVLNHPYLHNGKCECVFIQRWCTGIIALMLIWFFIVYLMFFKFLIMSLWAFGRYLDLFYSYNPTSNSFIGLCFGVLLSEQFHQQPTCNRGTAGVLALWAAWSPGRYL